MESDKDIINKYLAGNKDYFEILVNKHLSHVFNFVVRYSGDREGAADLVQETWLRVWRNLKKFDTDKKFITWVFTIAHHVVIDWQRKKKALTFSELDTVESDFKESLAGDLPSPEEIFDQKFLHEKFREVVEALSSLEQSIILLHLEQNLSFIEIAEVLNKPQNTVKSIYRRALLKVKEKWPDGLR